MKKLTTVLFATMLLPIVSFASLDCEDVVYMSQESTRLSAEVSRLPRGLQSVQHQNHVIDIAYKIVSELDETAQLPASNISDADYDRFKSLQSNIESNSSSELVRQLERGDLQYLNNLRVSAMSNIRQLYARCLNR